MRRFAEQIGTVDPADEPRCFDQGTAMLGAHLSAAEFARWKSFADLRAYNEAAVALYRGAFPEQGFQFGLTAAVSEHARSRGLASTWRPGDPHAAIHDAATPALALLRATAMSLADRLDRQMREQCAICDGLGWFITAANRKKICRHGREAA
jgi:hypothetical protein